MRGQWYRSRRVLVAFTIVLAGAIGVAATPAQQPRNFDAIQVRSLKVQENVYVLAGAGGNVTVQTGDQGVLVVDTQFTEMADRLLAEIARLSGNKPIRYVINTHVHGDHVGGNERFRRAGRAIVAGNVGIESLNLDSGAELLAHENVLSRLSRTDANAPPAPGMALPTSTYFGDRDEVFFNDEAVELLHQPAAHTDGDTIVFFRKSDVIAAGDVYTNTGYPFIDLARGGSIQGVLNALNRIIELTIPRDKQEGGTMVVPGHGRLADEADVVEYRDMVTIIRDRIEELMKGGMTLEQIKAAAPTSDYDGRYGATTGLASTDGFVEAVYRTLGGK